MARNVQAVQTQDLHAAAVQTPRASPVVAERDAGRGLGRSRGCDLQVEALHARVLRARGDLDPVAAALAGCGREQLVAGALDARAPAHLQMCSCPGQTGWRAGSAGPVVFARTIM